MMMFYYRGSSPFQMTGDSANDIRIDNVFLERLMDLMSFIKDIATPVLAVMGSTIALFQGYRGHKEKIRAQAEQISAWWARVDDDRCGENEDESDNRFGQPPHKDALQYHVGMVLLNQSQTPIRNLAVYGEAYKMEEGKRSKVYKMENGKRFEVNEPVKTLLLQPILVPGEFISFAVVDNNKTGKRPWTYPEELSVIKETIGKVRPIINDEKWKVDVFIFEDAAGRCWVRRENGKLSRYWFYYVVTWFYKLVTFLKSRLKLSVSEQEEQHKQTESSNNDSRSLTNPLNYKECFKNDETENDETENDETENDETENDETKEVSVYS